MISWFNQFAPTGMALAEVAKRPDIRQSDLSILKILKLLAIEINEFVEMLPDDIFELTNGLGLEKFEN